MYHSGRIPDYNPKEPMGLMYIGAALKQKGNSVEILDADILALSLEQTFLEITKRKAKIIGFSIMQRALPSVKALVEKLRKSGVQSHICCGGITATLSPNHLLERIPGIDSIVLGEGEITFSALTKAIKTDANWKSLPGIAFRQNSQVVLNKPAAKPAIDSLPWPIRDLLPVCFEKSNYATVLASRGCYGTCTFCSNQGFEKSSVGSQWRGRNPVDVVDEIEELRYAYGIKLFKFNDPNMFGPGTKGTKHVTDICNEILSRNIFDLHLMGFCRSNDVDETIARLMKQAGFERILMGIESANPHALKMFRKGESLSTIRRSIDILRRVGIDIVPGFMIFNPYTTLETLENDIEFLELYNFTPTLSKSLRIFDGMPIQEIMAAENRLISRSPFEGYHEYLVDPSIAAIYMALKTVSVEWIDLLHKKYQDQIWGIKKATAFNNRFDIDALNRMVFALEKDLLITLISWIKYDFTYQDIISKTSALQKQLDQTERFIVSNTNLSMPTRNIDTHTEVHLAKKINSILTKRSLSTFPERYRWRDD